MPTDKKIESGQVYIAREDERHGRKRTITVLGAIPSASGRIWVDSKSDGNTRRIQVKASRLLSSDYRLVENQVGAAPELPKAEAATAA